MFRIFSNPPAIQSPARRRTMPRLETLEARVVPTFYRALLTPVAELLDQDGEHLGPIALLRRRQRGEIVPLVRHHLGQANTDRADRVPQFLGGFLGPALRGAPDISELRVGQLLRALLVHIGHD